MYKENVLDIFNGNINKEHAMPTKKYPNIGLFAASLIKVSAALLGNTTVLTDPV